MVDLRDLSDGDLVDRALQAPPGDTRAFEALVSRHQDRIVTNCRCITRSAPDAPDLTQEVFVKAFFGLSSFERRAQFATWLNRIKVNHCLNFLKKAEGRKEFVSTDDPRSAPGDEPSVEPEAERRVDSEHERRKIQAVLDSLPDTLRVPLVLRELDGFAYQEIADQLGIGLSAVKMRIKRAREEFRRRFDGRDEPVGTGPASRPSPGQPHA